MIQTILKTEAWSFSSTRITSGIRSAAMISTTRRWPRRSFCTRWCLAPGRRSRPCNGPRLNPNVDKKIGPQTLRLINIASPELLLLRMAVAKVRQRDGGSLKKDPSQRKFLDGWINRALKYV